MASKEDSSPWRLFCIGVVAENKPLSTNNILFTPLEKTPLMQGDLMANAQQIKVEGTDASGNKFQAQANTDAAMEATWLPSDANRDTAPDVMRGEKVFIYRYADGKTYFWREMNTDRKLRRGETIRWSASATLDPNGTGEVTEDTHYLFELSGHTGAINLLTSQANGEKSRYQFTIDGKGGLILLGDGEGNRFSLDTVNTVVQLMNAMETVLQLNQRDFLVAADEDGVMQFARMLIDLKQNGTIQAKDFIKILGGKRIELEAIDILLNGILHLNGPIVQDDGVAGGYVAQMKGPLTVEKEGTFNNVTVSGHDHDETGSRTKKPNQGT
ncbi:baseplate assembly protein [Erwinia phage PhiEaH1]|uniref:Uncharacterized protein n=1 Tax=Erwinia phage PhiEaH1 TaxID=1401669 RepID=W8CZZ9_9CAUD|nr:baseplate assembly protein [Erwinia phage PhiEaH1]AGX01910.1 hypothetical protein [Erwinia phage PhiEaH1]